MSIELQFNYRILRSVNALSNETWKRIDLATKRAADIVVGKLRAFSARDLLHARTGTLARTWTSPQKDEDGKYTVSNPTVYAAIHEYGGEVTPSRAQALAIPFSDGPALTSRGVPRYKTAREAYQAESLFVLQTRSGGAILAKRSGTGAKAKLDAWYMLRASAQIPERRYATKAIEAARPAAIEEVKRAITE